MDLSVCYVFRGQFSLILAYTTSVKVSHWTSAIHNWPFQTGILVQEWPMLYSYMSEASLAFI